MNSQKIDKNRKNADSDDAVIRKVYVKPQLQAYGDIADVIETGSTMVLPDIQSGYAS